MAKRMSYRLIIPRDLIERVNAQVPPNDQKRLKAAVSALRNDPFPAHQHKRLSATDPPIERLRVGNYRVLYEVAKDEVHLLDVIHRRELSRWLREHR